MAKYRNNPAKSSKTEPVGANCAKDSTKSQPKLGVNLLKLISKFETNKPNKGSHVNGNEVVGNSNNNINTNTNNKFVISLPANSNSSDVNQKNTTTVIELMKKRDSKDNDSTAMDKDDDMMSVASVENINFNNDIDNDMCDEDIVAAILNLAKNNDSNDTVITVPDNNVIKHNMFFFHEYNLFLLYTLDIYILYSFFYYRNNLLYILNEIYVCMILIV